MQRHWALDTTASREIHVEESSKDIGDENSTVALIRMCGSQLQRTYKKKLKETERFHQKSSVNKSVEEQLAVVDSICMNEQEKAMAQGYLLVTDEGGTWFPTTRIFSPLERISR